MWSKRDRVLAVLSGEKPDRAPIFEHLIHDGILERFGAGRIATGDFAAVVRACSRCLDLCHPAATPQEPRVIEHSGGVQQVIERWTTWKAPEPLRGEAAMIKQLHAEIEAAEAWAPSAAAQRDFCRKVEATNRAAGDMVYIHVGAYFPILPFDIEQGVYAYMDQPELTRRWNQAMFQKLLRENETMPPVDLGPVAICWNDIAFKGKLLYPPYILEELFYPHLRALVELLHGRGLKVLFHSDGDVTEALQRLVDCGIDAFNPLELSAGMTLETFQEICGTRVALAGGIDAVDVLARGTPKVVTEKTRALIDRFRGAGNLLVASASGEVDNSMPAANVLAMYETVWDYGKY
ncbi:MAG: hypothetical protein HYV35_07810 [Lentisphaerae bacterium]|nr:hypothetical protein [Lentisphaerota bacterium]